jgi:hypothetical protein
VKISMNRHGTAIAFPAAEVLLNATLNTTGGCNGPCRRVGGVELRRRGRGSFDANRTNADRRCAGDPGGACHANDTTGDRDRDGVNRHLGG